ncbi:substrate-binding periplasmic protein [Candidatus Terasakiella magnetica]|uniref:substrate-binding periplasmic protein n=1 Tax=Candidatus Terasakiella magnetica TaxID=1867952 RepID=UPI0013F4FA3B|nr:transporter substrate-binding domain-containing protein [Candidatus Terasakiella magnetica]
MKIAVGLSIPPYVIKEKAKGIEYDILKEVLNSQGYEMEPVYVPLSRTLHLIKYGQVDGIMSTGQKDLPGCYTNPHITYWNFAITLKSRNLEIHSVADLQDKTVLAFQNASKYLGAQYAQMTKTNPKYKEIADQSVQNKLLFNKRVDVVIADRYIFEWFRTHMPVKSVADTSQEVVHHRLFDPSHFSSVFKDSDVCLAFNKGLEAMKVSGRYGEIIASYGVGDPDWIN